MTFNCSLSSIHTVELTFYFIEKGTRWEGGGNYYINLKKLPRRDNQTLLRSG